MFRKFYKQNDAEKFVESYEEDVTGKDKEDNSDAENPLDSIESVEANGTKKYL